VFVFVNTSMGTKTIGVREDVYERLRARKRENESFTDVVDRLSDETTADWREGFGTLPGADAAELERLVAASRRGSATGLADRQREASARLSDAADGE